MDNGWNLPCSVHRHPLGGRGYQVGIFCSGGPRFYMCHLEQFMPNHRKASKINALTFEGNVSLVQIELLFIKQGVRDSFSCIF